MLDLDTLWADRAHISFLEINSYVPPKMKYEPHRPTECQDKVPDIILYSLIISGELEPFSSELPCTAFGGQIKTPYAPSRHSWGRRGQYFILQRHSYVLPKMEYKPHRPEECQDKASDIILFSPKEVLGSFFISFPVIILKEYDILKVPQKHD